jgi:hypothetical protein
LFIIQFPSEVPQTPRIKGNQKGKEVKSPVKTKSDTFLPEYFQVDARELLLPERTKLSVSCVPPGYNSFSFAIELNRPFLDSESLRKFTPSFLFLRYIRNMPLLPETRDLAPVFFKCSINDIAYVIRGGERSPQMMISCAIPVVPSSRCEVKFEVHDRDPADIQIPSFIGTCLVLPTQQRVDERSKELFLDIEPILLGHTLMKSPYGIASFNFMPQPKARMNPRRIC